MNSYIKVPLQPDDVEYESDFWGTGDGFKPAKPQIKKIIRYQTDVALEEQVKRTRSVQKELSECLDQLEVDVKPRSHENLTFKILSLYKKAEHLSFVIEVLEKIGKELKYCRKKHSKVFDKEARNAVLHRIKWLERSIFLIVESNNLDKLDSILQIPAIPTVVKEKAQKSPDHHLPTLQKSAFSAESYAGDFLHPLSASPPKSILHLTPDLALTSSHTKTPSPVKKAVTLVSPPLGKLPHDAADLYWKSRHHQFEYTPNIEKVLEENPQSLHSLGLAVHANFVPLPDKDSVSKANLPWLTEQNVFEGNFDITREDLERVLRRARRIREKIYLAANMSVEFDLGGEDAVEDRLEQKSIVTRKLYSRGSTRVGGSTALSARSTVSKKSSRTSLSPSLDSGTFQGGDFIAEPYDRTQDYLPLTKTNRGKDYPYECDRWTDARPDPDHTMLQQSIVDQRNLFSQTRIKLFVRKRRKNLNSVKRDLITPNSVTSNRSFRKVASGIRFIEKLKSSGGNSLSQIQRDRLKDLLENGMTSSYTDERACTARSLAQLGITDSDQVIPVLLHALETDKSPIVRFEASKALINLGDWHAAVISELTLNLANGNIEIKLDALEQIACASNVRSIYLDLEQMPEFDDMVQVLKELILFSPTQEVSFHSAVCLGELCGGNSGDKKSNDMVKKKLRSVVLSSDDWTARAQGLEVLIRRLNFCDPEIFNVVVKHLQGAVKWKDRLAAALLIAYLGPMKIQEIVHEDKIYRILYRKIWDDAKREVRLGVSQAITALGLRIRLLDDVDEALRHQNEEIRSQAVIAMSASGIRSDTTLRVLVEMLGLDSSDYVRLQVIRTFHALGVTDIRVVRSIRERDRSGGPLARAARRYLSAFDIPLTSSQSQRHGHNNDTSASEIHTRASWTTPFSFSRSNLNTRASANKLESPVRSTQRHHTPHSERNLLSSSTPNLSPDIKIISTEVRKRPTTKSSGRSFLATSASSFF